MGFPSNLDEGGIGKLFSKRKKTDSKFGEYNRTLIVIFWEKADTSDDELFRD